LDFLVYHGNSSAELTQNSKLAEAGGSDDQQSTASVNVQSQQCDNWTTESGILTVRCHAKSRKSGTSADIAEASPKISPKCHKQAYYCDEENCSDNEIFCTATSIAQSWTIRGSTDGNPRGRTRKTHLRQNLAQETDQLKKDLQKDARKILKQSDPLYDSLKQYHDSIRKKLRNTTTEKLSAEVVDVISNTDLIDSVIGSFTGRRMTRND